MQLPRYKRPTVRQIRSIQIILGCIYLIFDHKETFIFGILSLELSILFGFKSDDEPVQTTKELNRSWEMILLFAVIAAMVIYTIYQLWFSHPTRI